MLSTGEVYNKDMTNTLSKTKTWKKKDILIADGFPGVKAGKGRLSLEANERLTALALEGYIIDGVEVKAKPATATAPATTTVTKAKPVSSTEIQGHMEFRYPEAEWEVVLPAGAKGQVGMRNVCTNCNGSLVVHVCSDPSLMINGVPTPVEIVGKRA